MSELVDILTSPDGSVGIDGTCPVELTVQHNPSTFRINCRPDGVVELVHTDGYGGTVTETLGVEFRSARLTIGAGAFEVFPDTPSGTFFAETPIVLPLNAKPTKVHLTGAGGFVGKDISANSGDQTQITTEINDGASPWESMAGGVDSFPTLANTGGIFNSRWAEHHVPETHVTERLSGNATVSVRWQSRNNSLVDGSYENFRFDFDFVWPAQCCLQENARVSQSRVAASDEPDVPTSREYLITHTDGRSALWSKDLPDIDVARGLIDDGWSITDDSRLIQDWHDDQERIEKERRDAAAESAKLRNDNIATLKAERDSQTTIKGFIAANAALEAYIETGALPTEGDSAAP